MTYTEKELDQFLHGISLSLLSKKSAQHWRYDEETAKEIEWLEVLERKVRADKADRKTEPSNIVMPKAHGRKQALLMIDEIMTLADRKTDKESE